MCPNCVEQGQRVEMHDEKSIANQGTWDTHSPSEEWEPYQCLSSKENGAAAFVVSEEEMRKTAKWNKHVHEKFWDVAQQGHLGRREVAWVEETKSREGDKLWEAPSSPASLGCLFCAEVCLMFCGARSLLMSLLNRTVHMKTCLWFRGGGIQSGHIAFPQQPTG